MKKIFAILVCAAMLASLASCKEAGQPNDPPPSEETTGSPQPNGEAGGSLGLLQSGTLKVGAEIGYPPFEFYDDEMNPVGLDIDIAYGIAEILGVEVEFVNTDFTMILNALDTNNYDVAISALTIDGERLQQVDFSTPYVENWQALVVKKGNPAVESMEGVEGLHVGFQDGTTSAAFIDDMIQSEQIANTTTSPYDQILGAFDDLKLDRIDCVLTDSIVAEGYIAREPDVYEITWHQQDDEGAQAEQFGIAVKKGNADLLKAVNDALAQLEESGRLEALRKEWLS